MPLVRYRLAALAAVVALAGAATIAGAQPLPGQLSAPDAAGGGGANVPIKQLDGVEIVEHLGAQLPLDAMLRDETGAPIQLGTLFGDGLPVILTFNYSACPMLCNVMLGGLTATLIELDWSAGKQFRIVTVGLDPTETHERAMSTKMGYLERYQRDTAEEGWRFLTGDAATVRRLTDATGFGYRRVPETGEILHPAALMLISPEGVVDRYMYGVEYDGAELKAALIHTALGKITQATTKFLLACFQHESSGFAATAMRIMRTGGLIFLFVFAGAFVLARFLRSRRTPRELPAGSH
jgi:protein SCO1/2